MKTKTITLEYFQYVMSQGDESPKWRVVNVTDSTEYNPGQYLPKTARRLGRASRGRARDSCHRARGTDARGVMGMKHLYFCAVRYNGGTIMAGHWLAYSPREAREIVRTKYLEGRTSELNGFVRVYPVLEAVTLHVTRSRAKPEDFALNLEGAH